MEVKGTAFISRKKMIIGQFGEEKFYELMKELSLQDVYFKNNDITLITMIPAEKFLLFNDFVLKKFYSNNINVYWTMGEKSAEFALVDGPYKILIKDRNIERVLTEAIPVMWKVYFTEGNIETKYEKGSLEVSVFNIPFNHYYFEYVVMGYCNKLINLCGASGITVEKLKTIDRGDKEIRYKFHFNTDGLNGASPQ